MSPKNLCPHRLTKIICTIGPASWKPNQLQTLQERGMNIARINLSHGTVEEQKTTIEAVQNLKRSVPLGVGILLDTKGCEIRTGDNRDPLLIAEGEEVLFVSDADRHRVKAKEKIIGVNYDAFAEDVAETDCILIDNGELSFDIVDISKEGVVRARAREKGKIGSRRHVNLPGADIALPSLTERDWADIGMAVDLDVDFIALSFIRNAKEVREVRKFLDEKKSSIKIITKIETQQSVDNIAELIEASDAIMVARGDLGAEVPFEDLPVIQDDIVSRCHHVGKPVIVATHMLESMTAHPLPTRAEVTDVAHAAMISTDATMLSEETAAGTHPPVAVEAMDRILRATETHLRHLNPPAIVKAHTESESRGESAVTLAASLPASAIVVITKTGRSARDVAKFRPMVPIIAITESLEVQGHLSLSYGVYPILSPFTELEETVKNGIAAAIKVGILSKGQQIVLLTESEAKGGNVISVQARKI